MATALVDRDKEIVLKFYIYYSTSSGTSVLSVVSFYLHSSLSLLASNSGALRAWPGANTQGELYETVAVAELASSDVTAPNGRGTLPCATRLIRLLWSCLPSEQGESFL